MTQRDAIEALGINRAVTPGGRRLHWSGAPSHMWYSAITLCGLLGATPANQRDLAMPPCKTCERSYAAKARKATP